MNADPTSLDRLHDIVAPPPVRLWPPAPAWYWVFGCLLVLVLVLVLALFLRWQWNRYRREALTIWRDEFRRLDDPNCRGSALVRLAELLKRTALSAFPREQVAGLTGTAWFTFLDQTTPKAAFDSGDGKLLEEVAYDSRAAATINAGRAHRLASLVHHWIRHHRIDLDSPYSRPRKGNEESKTRTSTKDEVETAC